MASAIQKAQRFIFFLRAYNDVDNIVPAIFFLLEEKPEAYASVVIYSRDFIYEGDPNLSFLQSSFPNRFDITYLHNKATLIDSKKKILRNHIIHIAKKLKIYSFLKSIKAKSMARGLPEDVIQKIQGILHNVSFPVLVVFDQNRMHAIGDYVAELRKLGVKRIVSLPVSPFINVNVLRASEFTTLSEELFNLKHDYSGFDEMGQTDLFYAARMKAIYACLERPSPLEGKVVHIGSLRYAPEWMEIRQKFMHSRPVSVMKRKLNIVFMLSDPKTNTNWDEVENTIRILGEFRDISLIIKPHTRAQIAPSLTLQPNTTIDRESNSSDLIDWADAVVFWGSSICIEAFLKKKICICLNHVHANENNVARYGAGFIVNSRDQLIEVVYNLLTRSGYIDYDLDNINKFIQEVVMAGEQGVGKIARKYVEFLERNAS